MMIERRSRGQPLVALVMVLGGWVGARAMAWESAIGDEQARQASALAGIEAPGPKPSPAHAKGRRKPALPLTSTGRLRFEPVSVVPRAPLESAVNLLPPQPTVPASAPVPPPALPVAAPVPNSPAGTRMVAAAGHHALWLAATALLPLPPLGLGTPVPPANAKPRRWSADGWLLLRPNPQSGLTAGPGPGTYGASQAGAVIRYRLDPDSRHKPGVYLRAATAIGSAREHEVAVGLAGRPLPGLPLLAMAEARANRAGTDRARVRPAVALVTELPPVALPLGFSGEVYAQAGWVGGQRPTAFIDGLARAERPVVGLGSDYRLKAGAGLWGAKQRGASRLDMGPVASLTVRLGDSGATARIEADWRLRVAGRSRPDSGPVLTLSTGF